MRSKILPLILLLVAAGCQKHEEPTPSGGAAAPPPAATAPAPAPAPAAAPAATAPPAGTPAAPPSPATAAAPAPAPAAAPAATPVIASQPSNWPGIVVEVTQFRRKGNTVTAQLRLRNQGSGRAKPEILYNEVYLTDLGAGKKYQALKDEDGSYIAALHQGWKDRWYEDIQPGESSTLWVKFPAPPPDVKSLTLTIPSTPPFDDLPIQDS
ncbi:MAG TPA: hypothetical protein VOA87_15805 [Thermoanaerobaculia bacterium]|nr:hypothetical protein [Thermoanaerobaculia bacterium]